MNARLFFASTVLASAAFASAPAAAVTLYDASAGGLPSAQGWVALADGAPAVQSVAGGLYTLDTTAAGPKWGNARSSPVVLNTATGFDVSFSLKVTTETHVDANRSGYSVVVIGNDPTKSVELAFWSNNIWVYDYDTATSSFVHGADVAFNTSALHNYTLAVRNQQYSLIADGSTLLTGSLHDYTVGGQPYTLPNFLFFGDDSSRGTSVTSMGSISVTAVPEPATAASLALGMAALSALAWRRRKVSTVDSASGLANASSTVDRIIEIRP